MYACMYASLCVRMYVQMYVYVCMRVGVYMYVCMYVGMCVCMHVCMYACVYACQTSQTNHLTKRAIRIIAGVPYGFHTKQLFLDLDLLNVLQIRTYQIGEFMFRYDRGLLPPAYNDFFGHVSKVHSHYTRNSTIPGRLGRVVGLMLPLALAAAVRVPYTTLPWSDLGQVVNLSLSVA